MIERHRTIAPRCLAVATAATAALVGLLALVAPVALAPAATTLDEALARTCAAVATVVGTWLWLGVLVAAIGAARGRTTRTGLPAPVRRAVLAACGVALAGGLAMAPADATPGQPRVDQVGAPAPRPATVVVAPGDTLWVIAERTLAPDAPDADVDARWRRIYLLNRAEIGSDPDLILPAQRLRVPISEVLP